MICKQCNFENDSDARFCENCGAALQGKNPVQANKGLMKVIWGCLVVLYVGVIVCYITGLVTEGTIRGETYRLDGVEHYSYHVDYDTQYAVEAVLIVLSSIVLVAVLVLFFVKQIKLSFAIIAALLSVYVFIGSYAALGLTMLTLVFFAAIITVLIYKYSFAENKKLL
jgi:hypothetical protein